MVSIEEHAIELQSEKIHSQIGDSFLPCQEKSEVDVGSWFGSDKYGVCHR